MIAVDPVGINLGSKITQERYILHMVTKDFAATISLIPRSIIFGVWHPLSPKMIYISEKRYQFILNDSGFSTGR